MDRRRDGREAALTEYTRPATWDDVKAIARYLEEAGVEYSLAGGYALGAHGFNRFTEDVDVLVDPSAENSRRWVAALSRLPDAAAAELASEDDVFRDDKRYAIRINDEFTVDVMPAIAGHTWAEMKPHVITLMIDDVPVRVLDLPGLLKTKQGVLVRVARPLVVDCDSGGERHSRELRGPGGAACRRSRVDGDRGAHCVRVPTCGTGSTPRLRAGYS